MKIPNQALGVGRPVFESVQSQGRAFSGVIPSSSGPALPAPGGLAGRPGGSRRVAVDHTIFRMLASGCHCISPNCVAMSCPAECVRGGVFVC